MTPQTPLPKFLFCLLLAWSATVTAQVLEVSEAEQKLLRIEVQGVALAAAGSTGELTLRVGFSPDGEWAIKTPFPGILHRAWVQVGDRVRKDDPLMTVRSPEVVSLQKSYLKARAELNLQESAWARDSKLNDAGSISDRRWQETRFTYDTARAEFAGLRAQLLLAGFSDADLQRLSRKMEITPDITLRAPADSVVLERPAMLGDHLEGTEMLARLGEPEKLILEGILSNSAASHLREGMSITLQGGENKAVLVLVSSVIDPKTQTVQVRAEPMGIAGLKPGQLTRWSVQSGSDLLTVPSSAIVKLDGLDVAYVQVPGGFEPRPVDVRSTGSGNWIVLGGLSPGDRVAVSGTAVLKGMSVGMGGGDG
jgi:cobalt-zinc-cadmium efflux system membrane fusion protein